MRFPVEFGLANVLPLSFVVLKTMFVTSSDIVVKAPLSVLSKAIRLDCCFDMKTSIYCNTSSYSMLSIYI
jgi:hypothetical protein